MARQRRFSEEPFGATITRLMEDAGITYRGFKTFLRIIEREPVT